ncbi:MAG: hypothetical protein JXR03_10380 [Cyclobacteriaceae bacterium]
MTNHSQKSKGNRIKTLILVLGILIALLISLNTNLFVGSEPVNSNVPVLDNTEVKSSKSNKKASTDEIGFHAALDVLQVATQKISYLIH